MGGDQIEALASHAMQVGDLVAGRTAAQHASIQVPDLSALPPSPLQQIVIKAGYSALLAIPLLLNADRIVGALVVRRKEPGPFPNATVELLRTFAAQSVLAIQNARLFHELREKSRQ